jgi:hypothetical protein
VTVEPLTAAHVEALDVQPSQAAAFERMRDPSYFRDLTAGGRAWAARVGGQVIALAGLIDMGGGRAVAWCFLGCDARRHLLALVRTIRRMLAGAGFGRVEMVTQAGAPPQADFARALGFEFEAQLLGWLPPATEGGPRRAALLWRRL